MNDFWCMQARGWMESFQWNSFQLERIRNARQEIVSCLDISVVSAMAAGAALLDAEEDRNKRVTEAQEGFVRCFGKAFGI